jgi:hypothetical protein
MSGSRNGPADGSGQCLLIGVKLTRHGDGHYVRVRPMLLKKSVMIGMWLSI